MLLLGLGAGKTPVVQIVKRITIDQLHSADVEQTPNIG